MKIKYYEPKDSGVLIETSEGTLIIDVLSQSIIRCVYSTKTPSTTYSALGLKKTLFSHCEWSLSDSERSIIIQTEFVRLEIDFISCLFHWQDRVSGQTLLMEAGKELEAVPVFKYSADKSDLRINRVQTVDGERNFAENLKPSVDRFAYRGKMYFSWQDNESLHGLGQGEEGIYNYRGNIQYLYQHNMRTPIPFLISDHNYGILFDCGSLMTFNDDVRGSYMFFDTIEQLDYYFVYGNSLDKIIEGFRKLTGDAPLLPKWAYGYIQSKEAYNTQEELVSTAAEYRRRKIPLDCIVQDWNTWEPGKWGNKKLDLSRYPDIRTANRLLKEMNIHSMVSIWPNMSADCDNYNEFQEHGFLLADGSTYDAFNESARELYWQQADLELFQGGFDSWWCDSTEPFSGPDWNGATLREAWERFSLVGDEHKKYLDPAQANMFALRHAQGIFENQRKSCESKRVVNLTRSGYAGSQQFGTILWSGDISANWDTFEKQITEGLNFCMSGLPYWTLDIGGFFVVGTDYKKRGCGCSSNLNPLWFWNGNYNNGCGDFGYRELYVRWLEYATFLPVFRSHGTDTPREIWNFGEEGTPFYDAIEKFIRLRYCLIPYIYSMAYEVTYHQKTIMRSLLFDFAADDHAKKIGDQFMFGPSLLICPIYKPMYYDINSTPIQTDKKWNCYLPSGCDWFDFWSDQFYEGGQNVIAEGHLDQIPVFVRAGSIIPMETDKLEYANQKSDLPFEIHIYPGANAYFLLYEDSGDGYSYEQGDFNAIQIRWIESTNTFTIGEATKEFDQTILNREIKILIHNISGLREYSFIYDGKTRDIAIYY